jgi:nucleoside-diphosphate-sugar epimerase
MKSVLVTGGLGFVGSHLVDQLLGQGCQVTIVDSMISNVVGPEAYSDRCRVLCTRVEDAGSQLSPSHGCYDEVYHLASVVGPAGVLDYAGDIARSVVLSGEVTAQVALEHGARLIIASTSEVYGRPGCLHETDTCQVSPDYSVRLEYAVAKLASEVSVINKAKVTDLHVNVVRPFNIAGPRQLPTGGFVLPRFVVAALTGQPLTVFGDGNQVRAFTDVRDIVTGLMAVMASSKRGMVLNLGNPANEIAILDLARRVLKQTKTSSRIIHVDPKELFGPLYEEGIERVPVVDRALDELDWRPVVSVEETIQSTVEYYRARPDLLQQERLAIAAA